MLWGLVALERSELLSIWRLVVKRKSQSRRSNEPGPTESNKERTENDRFKDKRPSQNVITARGPHSERSSVNARKGDLDFRAELLEGTSGVLPGEVRKQDRGLLRWDKSRVEADNTGKKGSRTCSMKLFVRS